MTCIDGIDPADFASGIIDPGDDPSPPAPRFDVSDGRWFDLGAGNRYVEFDVTPTPVNYTGSISVLWSTANGSALAGTHYNAVSFALLTFAAGEGTKVVTVTVLTPAGASGSKTFSVVLSSPSAGTTIGDGTGAGTIYYAGAPPTPGAGSSYTGWPRTAAYVYNQFTSCLDSDCNCRCGGCRYKSACTGFAGAAITSCHRWRDQGDKRCYDAKALFSDSGGPSCSTCVGCVGLSITAVLDRMVSNGADLCDTAFNRKMASWSQISSSTGDLAEIIRKLKRAITDNGCASINGIWYSDWNSAGSSSWPNHILPSHGSGTSTIGHSYVAVGWNDNIAGTGKGGFEIQSSHGPGWANGGRAWLPYSYLRAAGTKPNPWYRYYRVNVKPGG